MLIWLIHDTQTCPHLSTSRAMRPGSRSVASEAEAVCETAAGARELFVDLEDGGDGAKCLWIEHLDAQLFPYAHEGDWPWFSRGANPSDQVKGTWLGFGRRKLRSPKAAQSESHLGRKSDLLDSRRLKLIVSKCRVSININSQLFKYYTLTILQFEKVSQPTNNVDTRDPIGSKFFKEVSKYKLWCYR